MDLTSIFVCKTGAVSCDLASGCLLLGLNVPNLRIYTHNICVNREFEKDLWIKISRIVFVCPDRK